MPMGVAGVSGTCRFVIVEDPPEHKTPPLVPISLSKTWDAVLEPRYSLMTLRDVGVVTQLSDITESQYQTVNMMGFGEDGWE
eukprot:7797266-Karenia_brevis.AAC.1